MLKKIVKWLVIVLAVAFVAIQFVRPSRTNPPIDPAKTIVATGKVPADVRAIVERSCNDCHSSATVWPWYSNVAPISWQLAEDVEHGRKELNFSVWGDYTARRREHKLEEVCEQVQEGEMPPKNYLYTHRDARLSDADRKRLCEWSSAFRTEILASGAVEAERGRGRRGRSAK
jgi:hypothetical protein